MRTLILSDLHLGGAMRSDLLRRAESLTADQERADQKVKDAVARQKTITEDRAKLRTNLRTVTDKINRLKMATGPTASC